MDPFDKTDREEIASLVVHNVTQLWVRKLLTVMHLCTALATLQYSK